MATQSDRDALPLSLIRAFRIGRHDVVAFVGAGGKSTLMFCLAGELAAAGLRVVTTTTTHLFSLQMRQAPASLMLRDAGTLPAELPGLLAEYGHVAVAGGVTAAGDKVQGLPPELIDRLAAHPAVDVVLAEADGARGLPFKAPAGHEPVIPASATLVCPVVGLDVLGRALGPEHVHRPEQVAALTGAALGDTVSPQMIAQVLAHHQGGAKGAPAGARLVPFLNKASDASALSSAREIARLLLAHSRVESALIGAAGGSRGEAFSGRPGDMPDRRTGERTLVGRGIGLEGLALTVREAWGRVGAVVLAAGAGTRFGALKQALPWHGQPLVAHIAAQALACADVQRVAVTVGAEGDRVRAALAGANVQIVPVPDWAEGQSRSVRAGLEALRPGNPGAVLFLLADQPGVSPALLSALIQRHRETLAPVVAPRHRGRRGNPVLFDRAVFGELAALSGDVGGRPVLQAHRDEVAWVDWPTPEILQDIDTAGDYRALTVGDGGSRGD